MATEQSIKRVILNKFDGGQAEDVRTFNTDECEVSKNFDLFTNPHKLIPFEDSVAETANGTDISTMDDARVADVEIANHTSSYVVHGGGRKSGSDNKPSFYTKASAVGTTLFTLQGSTSDSYSYVQGSLVTYKGKAFCLGFNLTDYRLYRYDGSGTVTHIGTISTSEAFYAKPFVHTEDNILYIVIGNTITSWNGTSLVTTTTILPANMEATSICDYGAYLAIAMRSQRMAGSSYVYLWGRDTTINTLQGVVDFGEGDLRIIENLDNILIGIMTPHNGMSTALQNKIIAKGYAGGAVETLKSINIATANTLSTRKVKNGGKIYFSLTGDDAIYAFGKNKEGRYIITKDKYLFNGTTGGTFVSLSMLGDILWRAFFVSGGAFTLMRSVASTFASTSLYRTTINPKMVAIDRGADKQLIAVRISYTGASSGTTVLKYAVDGGSFNTIISDTNSTGEKVTEATKQNDQEEFLTGREFQFQVECSGGSQIKEIYYEYRVLPTV